METLEIKENHTTVTHISAAIYPSVPHLYTFQITPISCIILNHY